jgi:hypothetical protein
MSEVQVEQKSYQMPPQDGITVAHFLTVADIERSLRRSDTRQTIGNAQRSCRPRFRQQLYEYPRRRHSSVL